MKSNNYWKKLNKIFTIIVTCALLFSQEGEVVEITKDIGYTLDAEENLYYKVFTDIPNFESAQFFEISRNRIESRISFVEFTKIKISKRAFDLKEFDDLQFRLKQMPTITDDIRESFRKNFKMSYDDFLIEFETFINLKSKEQLKILDQIN